MWKVSTDQLKRAVEDQHGGKATFLQFVPVHEEHDGQTAWDVSVAVFELRGQPDGHFRAYAWSYESPDGKPGFLAILHGGPIVGPREAVRAATVAEARAKR